MSSVMNLRKDAIWTRIGVPRPTTTSQFGSTGRLRQKAAERREPEFIAMKDLTMRVPSIPMIQTFCFAQTVITDPCFVSLGR